MPSRVTWVTASPTAAVGLQKQFICSAVPAPFIISFSCKDTYSQAPPSYHVMELSLKHVHIGSLAGRGAKLQ